MSEAAASAEPKERLDFKALFPVFLVVFVGLVGFGLIIPVFPFQGQAVGATPLEITLAMAAYSFGQVLGAAALGKLSDRFGRRWLMGFAAFGSALSYLIIAEARSIEMLAVARLFGGFMAGNIAIAMAYATDVSTEKTRAQALGLMGAAFGLGFVVGPGLGGVVAGNSPDWADFERVAFVGAGMAALSGVFALLFVRETVSKDQRAANRAAPRVSALDLLRARPGLARLVTMNAAVVTSAAMMESSFAIWAGERLGWGPLDVGLGFMLVGVIVAVMQAGLTGVLVRRFSEASLVRAGVVIYVAGLLLMAAWEHAVAAYAGLAITSVGMGLFSPSMNALTSRQASEADRGTVMGLAQSSGSVGRILGPVCAGGLYVAVAPAAPFVAGAILMALCIFLIAGATAAPAPAAPSAGEPA